jgi:tetratricopeptide (TPR) repeat protein
VNVQQVGQELGVKYVLEGSVQKSTEKIRVIAKLIDAETGQDLWSEKYDRELKDFFVLQDEIALKIIRSLQIKLTEGEQFYLLAKATENLAAWEASMKGVSYYWRFTREDNAKARRFSTKATELDAEFSLPVAVIGWTHLMEARFRWSEDPAKSLEHAETYANKALAMNEDDTWGLFLLAAILRDKKQHEEALMHAKHALDLEPIPVNEFQNA